MEKKKCSGCKVELEFDKFYKNKNIKDGRSTYCIECTKKNSKKYFERKKEKYYQTENDDMLKMYLLTNSSNDTPIDNNLLRIMIMEKMCYSLIEEINKLKQNFVDRNSVNTN